MEKTPYQRKLSHPDWQKKRLQVLERDNFTCQKCQSKDTELHCHHLYYSSDYKNPQDYPIESLVTLCSDCHATEEESLKELSRGSIYTLRQLCFNADQMETILLDLALLRARGMSPIEICTFLDHISYLLSDDIGSVMGYLKGVYEKERAIRMKDMASTTEIPF